MVHQSRLRQEAGSKIVNIFMDEQPHGFTEIVSKTKLSSRTVSKVLRSLVDLGWLERHKDSNKSKQPRGQYIRPIYRLSSRFYLSREMYIEETEIKKIDDLTNTEKEKALTELLSKLMRLFAIFPVFSIGYILQNPNMNRKRLLEGMWENLLLQDLYVTTDAILRNKEVSLNLDIMKWAQGLVEEGLKLGKQKYDWVEKIS